MPKNVISYTNEKIVAKQKVSEKRVGSEKDPKEIDGDAPKLDKPWLFICNKSKFLFYSK